MEELDFEKFSLKYLCLKGDVQHQVVGSIWIAFDMSVVAWVLIVRLPVDVSVAANALHATNNLQIIPDFSLKDSMDQTVLGLALWTGTPPH